MSQSKWNEQSNKWAARLDYLATLETGWYEGYGNPIKESTLNKAHELLLSLDCTDFNAPFIYPLTDGGLGFDWSEMESPLSVALEFSEDFKFEAYTLDISVPMKRGAEEGIDMEGYAEHNTESEEETITFLRKHLIRTKLLIKPKRT